MYPYYPFNQMRQPMTTGLNGRMVTNIEEARAAQIDLDGSQWFFPCPSEGKVYSKSINMNGLPVFSTYILEQPICQMRNDNVTLASRVEALEKIVKELKSNEHSTDDKSGAEQPTNV